MPGFVDVTGWTSEQVRRLGHADDDDEPVISKRRNYNPTPTVTYTADQVWACAVAADRINGGYVKEPVWNYDVTPAVVKTNANKLMVKHWLQTGNFREITEQDVAQGQAVRHYFNSFLFKEMSGKINDYERQALKIAQMNEFTGRNLLEFAIVSSLPQAMRRDQAKNELDREIRSSTQLSGQEGDQVYGSIEVISSRFNPEYNKWKIKARLGDSFVDFWYKEDLAAGTVMTIKGKIKSQRGDLTTQLNYVKKC